VRGRSRSVQAGGFAPACPALVFALLACGCTGAAQGEVRAAAERGDVKAALERYEALRNKEGPRPRALVPVARAVLEAAAGGDDVPARNAAFAELAMSGAAGEATLVRLAHAAQPEVTRARALSILVSRGHGGRRASLRRMLEASHPEAVAAAVPALDWRSDQARLLELLASTSADVRAAAARRFGGVDAPADVRFALAEQARRDPDARVRAAATSALGVQGPGALGILRGRLGDGDRSVRAAAMAALLQAAGEAGATEVAALLGEGPSHDTVEAARVLLTWSRRHGDAEAHVVRDARAHLESALRSGSGPLRGQAAVAVLCAAPEDRLDGVLLELLGDEADASVRLQLARTLHLRGSSDAKVTDALAHLARGGAMPAVQAAGLLAPSKGAKVVPHLERLMRHRVPHVRAAAMRALACQASQADRARAGLGDDDGLVRVWAAGAILRCG
jgi:hypothetical protein